MELITILIIGLTILGTLFFLGVVTLPFIIMYIRYKNNNLIDFIIITSHKNQTTMCTLERGREVLNEQGRFFVTAKFLFANSIKRNLGSEIRSEHLHPNIKGKRMFAFVAIKDQIPTPLNFNKKTDCTNSEGVALDVMPPSFSLTPNLYESGEFWLNALKSNINLYEKEKTGLQKLALIGGIIALIACIIGIVVIIAISLTVAPKYVSEVTNPGAGTPPPI